MAYAHHGLADGGTPGIEINVAPAQPENSPPSKTVEAREMNDGVEPRALVVADVVDGWR
jgi:hypothetical protein